MLELNKWFFVQLINFLVLLALLNYILFRPLLRLFMERDEKINGSLNNAKAIDKERDDLLHQMDAKLSGARNKAKTTFEELSKEGLNQQKNYIDEATKQAAEINKKAKEDIGAELKKAKETLRGEVESFSRIIVEKMIGV